MAEIENLKFSDKSVVPSDELIFSIIGSRKDIWIALMKHMQDNYKDSAGEWNYYNDGKRWLFKMLWKKKTVFWIVIMEDTFMVTFYFPDRAEPVIEESDLPQKIKEEFKNAKKYGATRGLSIMMKDSGDVENVVKLIGIKCRLK